MKQSLLSTPHSKPAALAAWLLVVIVLSGCSSLPRIDPSGRRLLIWPDPTPQPGVAAAPALPSLPSLPALPSLPDLGNVTVPPVFAGPAPIVPPPAPMGQALVQTVQSPVDEKLSITPGRLLAPVGSEVILKAGVCSKEGYLRTNRRIEWMLGQQGTGQFVTVGEQGEMDIFRLPWQRPNKQDNSYAVGYTTPFHVCLRRGNQDATDDVQVERGEAWISLTSATEGVSYVTASAPETANWDARRASATIYWVDAQWRLPQPISLQPGQTGSLTTTVTRQSDGAPITGWVVRYEVLSGETARLGYESGQTAEAKTDAQGRATMQITPTDDQPGNAQVRVTVIRPATSTPMPSPRLEVGGGDVAVSWSPSAVIVGPPIDGGVTPSSPTDGGAPPRPFEPPPTPDPGDTLGQPEPARGPLLEVALARDSSGPIRAGESIPVTVTLLNTGDRPAQNLSVGVEYDKGLSNLNDPLGKGTLSVPTSRLTDLDPGDSTVIELEFTAVEPGRQCYNVTASADGTSSAFERQCFDIERAAPAARPQLRIETDLDPVREVGQTLTYLVTVYNDGSAPSEGVAVEVYHDPQLKPDRFTEGGDDTASGLVAWPAERIAAGQAIRFEVQYQCLAPADGARMTTYAVFSESEYERKTDKVEIRTRAAPTPPPVSRREVEAVLTSSRNPARVGEAAVLDLTITNTTGAVLRNVQYRLRFPAQIRPTDLRGGTQKGAALEFPPIDSLSPGEPFRVSIPYLPQQQGVVAILLETRLGADGPVQVTEEQVSIASR